MNWLKDPLWIFLLCGTAIFFAADWLGEDDIPYRVEVRDADVQRLSDQWSMQMRRPPTEQELSGLVEQFVKEEIYYREARRRLLDVNDTIVRRRMVQKLTFLTEDIATAVPTSEAELRSYYNEHAEDYRLPQRYSFQHRYFSVDRRAAAEADARAALENDAVPGDPFMLQKRYALRSEREIGDLFGRQFSAAIAALTPGEQWQGPIRSAYGWHAVLLTATAASEIQPFESIIDQVAADAQQAARTAANQSFYAQLKDRYEVVFAGKPQG